MKKYHIPYVASTNSYILQLLADGDNPFEDGFVVYTMCQTAGRGQIGNRWESAPDQNISFSVYLEPGPWLEVREQFILSMITSLAVKDSLDGMGVPNVSIKWPNDIYAGHRKVCGILIENCIFSSRHWQSVVGVGINVNQTVWLGGAPNPTSIQLETGLHLDPEFVLGVVLLRMQTLISEVQAGRTEALIERYQNSLYRAPGTGFHPYIDAATGQPFMAETVGVERSGILHLHAQGEEGQRTYMFKEVRFVHPDGLTKE